MSNVVPDWLPGVEKVAGSDAGPMLPGSKWSLLLHTTEGPTLDGAVSALRQKSAWSHFIFDPDTERLVQAVSLNRAAKSLRSGGNFGKTNAARVIQVEIVGYAHDTPSWSIEKNEAVGRMIKRIHDYVPFRLEMPLTFYSDRAGFTVASDTAKQRMSWFNWYRFDAICGHQHAPRNTHWDPGGINTKQILAAADPKPIVLPKASWTPIPFPGHTLRQGEVSDDVATLKVLLREAGYGESLSFDSGKSREFGPGTVKAVQALMRAYYKNEKRVVADKDLPKVVGPVVWDWLNDVLVVKFAVKR